MDLAASWLARGGGGGGGGVCFHVFRSVLLMLCVCVCVCVCVRARAVDYAIIVDGWICSAQNCQVLHHQSCSSVFKIK